MVISWHNGIGVRSMSSRGYTLVEMMVSIAILSIMAGIVGYNYNRDKAYQTLNYERQRIASAIRAARTRDFNSIAKLACADDIVAGTLVHACSVSTDCPTGICSMAYPAYGYGIHFERRYNVCSNDSTKSCYADADCGSGNFCNVPNPDFRSSYVLFADFTNPDGNSRFDGGKTGAEYIEEFKVPKDYKLYFSNNNAIDTTYTGAEVVFDSGALVYKTGTSGTPITSLSDNANFQSTSNPLFIELRYAPNGGADVCGVQTRNKKASVTVYQKVNDIYDQIIACP